MIIFLLLKTAMELMGIVGVMVNCALIGQSGQVHRMFPNITGTQTILLIIILEVRNYWIKLSTLTFTRNLFFSLDRPVTKSQTLNTKSKFQVCVVISD